MADHPGIVFRDGPAGWRPALVVGPDVWELVSFLRAIDERGAAAVAASAEVFAIPESAVSAGIGYYTAHVEEIDTWIAEAREASERAEAECGTSAGASGVNRPATESLLLDEMVAPAWAESLSAAGFDVVAVAGHPVLAAASDHQVAAWAAEHGFRDLAAVRGRCSRR